MSAALPTPEAMVGTAACAASPLPLPPSSILQEAGRHACGHTHALSHIRQEGKCTCMNAHAPSQTRCSGHSLSKEHAHAAHAAQKVPHTHCAAPAAHTQVRTRHEPSLMRAPGQMEYEGVCPLSALCVCACVCD